jgi:shikimate dehydrogenase
MTLSPERYAVLGHPIAHSLSPWIHGQFALQTGQRLTYGAIDVAPEALAPVVRDFFAQGGCGLNITVPHKQAVLELLDTLSERACEAGAVNTIVREAEQRLRGDNTDGIGFVRDLTQNLDLRLTAGRVLMLGAGGAARGLLAPLLRQGLQELVIANRTAARARELAGAFAHLGPVRGAAFTELDGLDYALIINATAASLQDELPPLPAGALAAETVCYDLAYGHSPTRFVQWARQQGAAHAYMGTGMLVEQAAESYLLWHGVRPQTAPLLAALRSASSDTLKQMRQH